jgi:hypothetical protein
MTGTGDVPAGDRIMTSRRFEVSADSDSRMNYRRNRMLAQLRDSVSSYEARNIR